MTNPIGIGPLRHPLGRRRFMAAIAGDLLAAPLTAEAQQAGKVARIGYLSTGTALAGRSTSCTHGPTSDEFDSTESAGVGSVRPSALETSG